MTVETAEALRAWILVDEQKKSTPMSDWKGIDEQANMNAGTLEHPFTDENIYTLPLRDGEILSNKGHFDTFLSALKTAGITEDRITEFTKRYWIRNTRELSQFGIFNVHALPPNLRTNPQFMDTFADMMLAQLQQDTVIDHIPLGELPIDVDDAVEAFGRHYPQQARNAMHMALFLASLPNRLKPHKKVQKETWSKNLQELAMDDNTEIDIMTAFEQRFNVLIPKNSNGVRLPRNIEVLAEKRKQELVRIPARVQ